MVHYIRFLKVPRLKLHVNGDSDGQLCIVSCIVTLTTDLGESLYYGTTDLQAELVQDHDMNVLAIVKRFWHAGMHNLQFEFKCSRVVAEQDLRVRVSPAAVFSSEYQVTPLLGVQSDTISKKQPVASSRAFRHISLGPEHELVIAEDTGESIARHIWDAALALTAFVSRVLQSKAESIEVSVNNEPFRETLLCAKSILELGSGCGIVGLALASLLPKARVLCTDVAEATDLLRENIEQQSSQFSQRQVSSVELDWTQPLPVIVQDQAFDLIVFSDCTYNVDSIPALVVTVNRVLQHSPQARVLVALKRRHASEDVFFDQMRKAQLDLRAQEIISLEDDSATYSGDREALICLFGRR